jgi:hypothetical protein
MQLAVHLTVVFINLYASKAFALTVRLIDNDRGIGAALVALAIVLAATVIRPITQPEVDLDARWERDEVNQSLARIG